MITQLHAYSIAKSIIPDIDVRGFRTTDNASSDKLNKLPKECWYVCYYSAPVNYLSCSKVGIIFLCLSKTDGQILFHQNVD
jgi:hypothetical protein